MSHSETVIPSFIFDLVLIEGENQNLHATQFLMETLDELDQSLRNKGSKLYYFFGKPAEVVESIIESTDIDAVFVNKDYSPYAEKRDSQI